MSRRRGRLDCALRARSCSTGRADRSEWKTVAVDQGRWQAEQSRTIYGGNATNGVNRDAMGASARMLAHENTLLAMTSAGRVSIAQLPAAHTGGDSLVDFRRSDVISTGDVFRHDEVPFIDADAGGRCRV